MSICTMVEILKRAQVAQSPLALFRTSLGIDCLPANTICTQFSIKHNINGYIGSVDKTTSKLRISAMVNDFEQDH